jgi:membrane protein implicated in regulation of membrane protease activity
MQSPAAWQLWLVAGVGLSLLEIKLPGFVLLWLGVGALAAAIPAGFGLPLWVQLAVFCVSSTALLAASRTVFKGMLMRDATRIRTNADAMVGAEAVVVEPLSERDGGTVRINGELWSARSLTGPVVAGEPVVVERLDGLKLYVRKPGVPLGAPRNEGEAS